LGSICAFRFVRLGELVPLCTIKCSNRLLVYFVVIKLESKIYAVNEADQGETVDVSFSHLEAEGRAC